MKNSAEAVNKSMEQQYEELVEKAKNEHPGVEHLLKLYGQFDESYKQSQEYLELLQPKSNTIYSTSTGL
jgi:hypothetical protein